MDIEALAGVTSYCDFGTDLLNEIKRSEFTQSFLVCYRSAGWDYLQENVAFMGRRLFRQNSIASRHIAQRVAAGIR